MRQPPKLTSLWSRTAMGLAALLASAVALTDVVLHPGTIRGTIGLGSTPISSGQVWVPETTYPWDGYVAFQGGSFEVTVEGDREYPSIFVRAAVPLGTFDLWSTAPFTVPVGGAVTLDLARPSGTISVVPTVTGGTLTRTAVTALGSNAPLRETYTMTVSSDGPSGITFPMAPGAVTISGEAEVSVADPITGVVCSATVPLAAPAFELAPGQVVTQEIALTVTAADCVTGITGTLDLAPLPDGSVPTTWWIAAFDTADWSDLGQRVEGNGNSYLFTGVTPGTYHLSPYARYHPAGDPSLPAVSSLHVPDLDPMTVEVRLGQVTRRDFVLDTAAVHGSITAVGSAAPFARYAYEYISGEWASPLTAGGLAEAYGYPPDFAFTAALTPGVWLPRESIVTFGDDRAPIPWGAFVDVTDAAASPITVGPGDVVVLPPKVLAVTEGQVVFDVIEPPGTPTIGISNPLVEVTFWDEARSRLVRLVAYSSVSNAPTPSVRVVGPPGTYTLDAYATVRGTHAKFASSVIDLGRSVETPAGAGVLVTPVDAAGAPLPLTLTFCEVTAPGETTASLVDVGPAAPPDHELVRLVPGATYVDLVTTAAYATPPACGGIEVAVHYDPVALGLTPAMEASLELQQWTCGPQGSCAWQVLGSPRSPNPDTASHVVYGTTSRLGLLALTLPTIVLVPPTDTCVGAPSARAQLTTDPGTCAATIDNVNQRAGGCSGGGGGLLSCTFDGLPSEALAPGPHDVLVVGTAVDGSTAACTSFVDVVDRERPAVSCPPPVALECTAPTTPVAVSATCADACGGCAVECGAGPFPVGTTPVACNATDLAENGASCMTGVTVTDTVPPALTVAVSPAVLWPPDHKLVEIRIESPARDTCDPAPGVTCTASSNEAPLALGSGQTQRDVVWSNGKLLLRAERSGLGSGRVYTVTCAARDSSGNASSASATVTVPHEAP